MSLRQPSAFGTLLKQYRLAANLSQPVLAEQAGVSVDAISMLERGKRHAPHEERLKEATR